MVLRNLEVYENNPDSLNGINKFFNAYAMVKVFLNIFKDKELDYREFEIINNVMFKYRVEENKNKKHQIFVFVKKIIDKKYETIHKFLDLKEIKSSIYVPSVDLEIDRKKVAGCFGTIVEM